jgi:predicted RNA methylase
MKGKNFSANNVSKKRRKSDLYETPFSITRHLLSRVILKGKVLEPACGNGAICKVLDEYNITYDCYDVETDFLKETNHYDTIITNPPFSLAKEFIFKAKEISDVFYYLLPLSYLHGKERFDTIYTDKSFPLKEIYVFTRYPMLGEALREDGKYNTGMMVYAWYVWDKHHKGNSTINWIDNNLDVLNKKDRKYNNAI